MGHVQRNLTTTTPDGFGMLGNDLPRCCAPLFVQRLCTAVGHHHKFEGFLDTNAPRFSEPFHVVVSQRSATNGRRLVLHVPVLQTHTTGLHHAVDMVV